MVERLVVRVSGNVNYVMLGAAGTPSIEGDTWVRDAAAEAAVEEDDSATRTLADCGAL